MGVRIGINGLGRIGRSIWRLARASRDVEVVAVNDLADAATLAYLLRYDSIRGRSAEPVGADGTEIVAGTSRVPVFAAAQPRDVPWGALDVDVVVEATGRFTGADLLRGHLAAGAQRVVVSTAIPDADVTVIMGVNEEDYDPRRHRVVSPGCCTTNAIAPVVSVLRDAFDVLGAHATSVHAYDSAHSSLQDAPHRDPRMGRAAAVNMIPVLSRHTVGAVGDVFPELRGRVTAMAVRVPVAIGCLMHLVALVTRPPATADEVNQALAAAAAGQLKGYLAYTTEPLVSADLVGTAESCVVDTTLTSVVADSVRVAAWYDNEWGFANRLLDVVRLIGEKSR
jgi:glyceraldehyde 3-phosphate dehydrogenase